MTNRWIPAVGITFAWAVAVSGETPLGTGFTYQGRVTQNGQPVNGTANLIFALYDAPIGGSLLGSQTLLNTPVTDGLFSVVLNDAGQYGASAFNGGKRWLQISVNGTPLSTRQELTATPYALFARGPWATNGTTLSYTTGKVGIGTATPAQALSVAGTVQSSSGGFMFPDGTVQSTAATGGAGFWSANGTNIYKNNTGNVGIGTNAPVTTLDVRGQLTLDMGPTSAINTGTGPNELNRYLGIFNSTQYTSASGLKAGGILVSDSYAYANPGKNDLVVKGRIGIGTAGLTDPLTIETLTAEYGWTHTDRFRVLGSWVSPEGGWLGTRSNHPLHFFTNDSIARMTLSTAGNLGIGTTNPTSRVEIAGQDGLAITGYQPFLTLRDTNAGGARGILSSANGDVGFYTNSAIGSTPNLVIKNTSGNVGIGASAPARKLHTSANDTFVARFEGNKPDASVVEFRSSSSNATWEYGVSGSTSTFDLPAGSAYFYRQGAGIPAISMTPDYATRIHGTLKCNVLELLGADVAERFPTTDEKPEPGTVMEIDAEHPGELRISREAYSHRVAGVVSGAGDVPVGAVLGNLPASKDGPAIALSGRVWVRCEATQAPIAPGDLLTTSAQAGLAMKASDREKAFGAVLGKAMTGLNNGEGLVLVLVNLQ